MTENMNETTSVSSILAGKSDGEIENLLDRMLTRLALCDESKLQDLLHKLLPLSISALSSPSQSLRNKVLEILNHVNQRIKYQQEISLPLLELWELYMECHSAPMVRNFCIVYIEMAIDRAPMEDKENLILTFLGIISKIPSQHQVILLRISAKVIGECYYSQVDDTISMKYKNHGVSQDMVIFLNFWLHTLLCQPTSQSGGCPAGLSIAQWESVSGKKPMTSDILRTRKLGILNIVEVMDLPAELVYPLYLVASVDSQDSIARRGDELLKKNANGVNFEDTKLISNLFVLFNGNKGHGQVPQDSVTPGIPALRVRLMSVFCRSIAAANSFPSTLQCIFGCIFGSDTTSRLMQLGMEFTFWVFKHIDVKNVFLLGDIEEEIYMTPSLELFSAPFSEARIDQLKLMGPVILSGILNFLDKNSTLESDALVRETKTFAFQAIGLLAVRMPQLFREKTDMPVRLFDALKVEAPSLRMAIQEAIVSLASSYKDAPAMVLKSLEELLLRNYQVELSEVRFCAVKWATSLFGLQHCPSRYICMLAAADSRLDIREIALEGLFPSEVSGKSISMEINFKYPKLSEMLDYIERHNPLAKDTTQSGETKPLLESTTYVVMIEFLMKCFETDAQQSHMVDDSDILALDKLLWLLEHAMTFQGSVKLHFDTAKAFVTVAASVPQVVASRYAAKLPWLKQLLGHVDFDTRESVACLLGIVSSALPISESSDLICELISKVDSSVTLRFEMQHGLLCAIGYVTANCTLKIPSIPESLLQSAVKCLVDIVNLETSTMASIAMKALGHIGLSTQLPLFPHDSSSVAVLTLLQEKLQKLLFGDDIKAIQRIVVALGHMSANESSSPILNIALDLIFSLCCSKVEDILFAAGEALAFLWGGVPVSADRILRTNFASLSATSNFLMENVPSSFSSCNTLDAHDIEDNHTAIRVSITRKLFDELLYSSKKEERSAGTVWLLSLTKFCGRHQAIQNLLSDIQDAFLHLSGEQSELIQEMASQGLSMVYELGDISTRKNLVNALVGTLTGSGKRKRAVKLVDDTEVFQEGAMGQSPSAGKLSTYKELCNLANEMGQPDLIYKFMDLANYQASLNSKRGAAFGFSKIAKHAGDALQPYLRALIPRLVRYQYDPEKSVQDAMAHIWKSLVTDSKRTIDEHLELIMDDLLIQCGSRLWRSRESSCLALADIIQGRKINEVERHLEKLWKASFRAMDDIKETVRTSGDRLCRSLTTLTLRLSDTSLTEISDTKRAMDIVLPLFLTEGIMSKVDTVRKASIGLVAKVTKGSGAAIRPHLSDLVCCMLESLSSLEDQGLNYVELHSDNVGIQAEKLENLRISIAKGSPMWETLEFCIEFADSQSLELLVPRLGQLVRSGVGLNTRVGIGNFISLLVQKVGLSIKPFASMLLKLLFQVAKEEKSAASKRAFSNACASVLRYAAPPQAQKLIQDTASLHTGDRNEQISGAILLKSYSSISNDTLNGYRDIILPIIFVLRFDDDKIISNLYEELWEENMSSEQITLQLYMGEIVTLINKEIISSPWASKRRAASAICKLSEVLGELLSPHHHVLLSSLMKEVPGRLWEGKDALLNALSALCIACPKAIFTTNSDAPVAILNMVLSSCRKKVNKFREAAFCCLEQIIIAFKDPDFFNIVLPSIFEICNLDTAVMSELPSITGARAEADGMDNFSAATDKIVGCLTAIIHVALIKDILEQQRQLSILLKYLLSPSIAWTVKVSVFSSIKELCLKLRETPVDSLEISSSSSAIALFKELVHTVLPRVIECIKTIQIGQVHISASECLLDVINLCNIFKTEQSSDVAFEVDLVHLYEVEKNEQAKFNLDKCIHMLRNGVESKTSS